MIIYKTTNVIDGKIYVGQTSVDNEKYFGSGKYLKRAMRKYGKSNFIRETLCVCETKEELDEMELYWINRLDSRNPDVGYNIDPGGRGGIRRELTPEHKKKISNTLRGYKRPPFSDEHKRKLSEARKARVQSEETKKKISESLKGRKFPPEVCERISLVHKRRKQQDE